MIVFVITIHYLSFWIFSSYLKLYLNVNRSLFVLFVVGRKAIDEGRCSLYAHVSRSFSLLLLLILLLLLRLLYASFFLSSL